MTEERIINIETRLSKLEKDRKHMVEHIHELQITIEKLNQTPSINQNYQQPTNPKVEYLTIANEQMFKQNQRLREYIEDCIRGDKKLDQKGYLMALSGGE